MDKQRWKITGRIAATYIGTVVGAGFATGREIVEFFTMHGTYGTIGIFISGLLFVWLGTKMMLLATRIKAHSAQEFNIYLFGNIFGRLINVLLLMVLLGVTSVMLSGAGSVFKEQLQLPRSIGVIITVIACILVLTRGLQGIFEVNTLVVPIMMFFIITMYVITVAQTGPTLTVAIPAESWNIKWVTNPITYVAMNLALAQSVLVPLASEIKDEKVIKWGGIVGGAGLFGILLCSQLAILTVDQFYQYDIPMAEVVKRFNQTFHFFFVLVIFGEVFTTLIGNVYGMNRQLQSMTGWRNNGFIYIILLISYMISHVGYGQLLHMLYPLIGWVSLILLPLIAIKKHP
ncbi:GerAB/ArcD/ProY family transporter [Ectobacillus sp. JY-23]|uniref:YkvI family membrane protein n=1 Tax=Ectobacillus sp. JY-23 TaxID=2933872 RepID=UPI001FF337D5|nr:GerAB/ArcD/ProY family transporter [Ectobacillus sp. JY-23]UOY92754.1 GerAB/ArcD/ProY family transporter [Ectobacillus sp. JY-23]